MTILQTLRPGAWSAVMQRITRAARRRPKGLQDRPRGRVPATAGVRQRRLPMPHIACATLPARRPRDAIIRIILL